MQRTSFYFQLTIALFSPTSLLISKCKFLRGLFFCECDTFLPLLDARTPALTHRKQPGSQTVAGKITAGHFQHMRSNKYSSCTSTLKTLQLCFYTEEVCECCQRELKMAAESQNTGAEPSPADGGQACGWMAGFEGSSLLGWKWISERHNGSLRRVCGVVLKPCLRCPGCQTHLCPAVHAAANAHTQGFSNCHGSFCARSDSPDSASIK